MKTAAPVPPDRRDKDLPDAECLSPHSPASAPRDGCQSRCIARVLPLSWILDHADRPVASGAPLNTSGVEARIRPRGSRTI